MALSIKLTKNCIYGNSHKLVFYGKPSNYSNILTVRTPKIILNWRSQILAINSNSHILKRIFNSLNTADFPEKLVRVLPKSSRLRTLSRCEFWWLSHCEFWWILFLTNIKARYSLIDILFSASFSEKPLFQSFPSENWSWMPTSVHVMIVYF